MSLIVLIYQQNFLIPISENVPFGLFVVIQSMLFLIFVYNLRPRKYLDLKIFEKDRFEELRSASCKDIVGDFLGGVKAAFEHNEVVRENLVKCYYWSIVSIIITLMSTLLILLMKKP